MPADLGDADLVIPHDDKEVLTWGALGALVLVVLLYFSWRVAQLPHPPVPILVMMGLTAGLVSFMMWSFARQPFTMALRREHIELPSLTGPMRRIPYADIERAFTSPVYGIKDDVAIYLVMQKRAVPWYERGPMITRQLMVQGSRWDRTAITAEIQRRIDASAP